MRLPSNLTPSLYVELLRIERLSRKLSKKLFHSMLRHGPKLERQQLLLGRLVNIGTELFAMSCACGRANQLNQQYHERHKADPEHNDPDYAIETAKFVCSRGQHRIRQWLLELNTPLDQAGYKLAQYLMKDPSVH